MQTTINEKEVEIMIILDIIIFVIIGAATAACYAGYSYKSTTEGLRSKGMEVALPKFQWNFWLPRIIVWGIIIGIFRGLFYAMRFSMITWYIYLVVITVAIVTLCIAQFVQSSEGKLKATARTFIGIGIAWLFIFGLFGGMDTLHAPLTIGKVIWNLLNIIAVPICGTIATIGEPRPKEKEKINNL